MKVVVTTAEQLWAGGHRLDGSYHASDGVKTLRFVRQWAGLPAVPADPKVGQMRDRTLSYGSRRLDTLEDVCVPDGIFIPGRFKRVYVDDLDHGDPWLSPSDMLKADLSNLRLVSRKFTPEIETLRVHHRWILLSRSGTIGNLAYVREDMDSLVGSDDIIRIVADLSKVSPGYLYAFLSSSLGKALIEQKTYGAVVPHIEAHHVVDLPIPRLDPATEQRIHELLERAASLRVEASSLRQKALNLASEILQVDLSHFVTKSPLAVLTSRLDWRFEGAYHAVHRTVEPVFRFRDVNVDLEPIGNLLLDMFYLGKLHRVFVNDPEQGVPLLSIADAQKIKLTSEKFISRTRSRNVNQSILRKGMVLVSRVGTPGLVTYVRREMDGMAGTDHLVRLVCNESKVLPGYLYIILSSPVGYGLLVSSAHGSVQLVLPPEYIAQIEIPTLPLDEQQPIHNLVEQCGEALTHASESEDQAQALLAKALGMGAE
jgi:type I restriction enzyme S subunit